MHRFFVPGPLAVGATVQVNELAQQLEHVLRMQRGDELVLLDGSGLEFHGRLLSTWSAVPPVWKWWRRSPASPSRGNS